MIEPIELHGCQYPLECKCESGPRPCANRKRPTSHPASLGCSLLGHRDVKTTMIYTYVLNRGAGMVSRAQPTDRSREALA